MASHRDLHWDEFAQSHFEESVALDATATMGARWGREWVTYTGQCPYCFGASESSYSRSVVPTERGALGRDFTPVTVPMRCACASTHPSAPAGETGCGRTWDLTVQPEKGGAKIVSARPSDPATIAQNVQKREMHRRELTSVRAMAQNWRNGVGLSGIAGGAVGLIAIPTVISAADRTSVVDGAHLLLFGALFAAVAMGLALLASFGWPKRLDVSEPHTLAKWEVEEVDRSVRYLGASMIAAVVATAVLGCAGAVLLFEVPLFFHFADWK